MNLRVPLAALAFTALAYAGLSRVRLMNRRISVLRAFALDIQRLNDAMTYKRLPLKELAGNISPCALPEFWHAVEALLKSGVAAQTAFKRAADNDKSVMSLTTSEREVLYDYFAVLGNTELSGQNANAKAAAARLERLAGELESEKQRCGGLYGQLGIFGGLAAALILI